MISPAEINRIASEFWSRQRAEELGDLQDPVLPHLARNEQMAHMQRLAHSPNGLLDLLSFAEFLRKERPQRKAIEAAILSNFARRAARKPRPDSLQILIRELHGRNPKVTVKELCQEFEQRRSHGVIDDIEDGKIYFSHRGQTRTAKISGLRSRLARAKAENGSQMAGTESGA